jgi:hypothetical protein
MAATALLLLWPIQGSAAPATDEIPQADAAGRDSSVAAPDSTTESPSSLGDGIGAPGEPGIPQELAASTEPPWLPEGPVPRERSWETAVRFPFRVISLPFVGLGYVTKRTFLTIEETNFVTRAKVTFEPLPKAGFRIMPASLGDHTGLGLAVAYSPPVLKRHLVARFDGETTSAPAEAHGPMSLGYQYDWRPKERFFGIGPNTSIDDVSNFATQSQSMRLGFGQRFPARPDPDSPRWEAGAWFGPAEIVTRRGRADDEPSFEELFPAATPYLDQRVEHLVYGGRLALDHRRGRPHWGEGGMTSVEVERFDKPLESLALRTSDTPYRYTRFTYQAEGGVSFYREPRTFRLELQLVDNVPDATGSILPSELASLGGGRGMAGFESGRFHDLDAVSGRVSYIFPLAFRLEFDVHMEMGQVARDVWRDAKWTTLEHSYGVALRPRIENFVLGAIGLDWSRETVRFRFSVGGVE